jgi:hypothetical protein
MFDGIIYPFLILCHESLVRYFTEIPIRTGRDSPVAIATRYRVEGPGIVFR